MEPDHYHRAARIFDGARLLAPDQRRAFIEQAAEGDAQLARQIERMIEYAERAEPTAGFVAGGAAPADGDDRLIGAEFGRYRLVRLVGTGGFAAVYQAQQEHPVQRTVALKILKSGMDSRQVIARFDAERHALALMEHPGIARVLDAGQTDPIHGSRPYFVMEFVSGEPITEYCDRTTLDLRARLDLFCDVCRAVQHAHHKGIIHRDIKPSNVLITDIDGAAMPKVIDFGIAKAVRQPLSDAMLITGRRELLGTPQYMSPEQADSDERAIDTRTDVYSLGVLLYELLTGTTPLPVERLRNSSYSRIVEMIRQQTVERPSVRLQRLGEAASDLARRQKSDVATLRRRLRGDLDWIILKALEPDREQRYGSAAVLVEDIRRHLEHEPVLAGPPTTAYRVGKFVRRHRTGVAAAAAIIIVLVAGIVATTEALLREARAASNSSQIAAFMQQMLGGIDPAVARGKDTELLRRMFEDTAARIGADLGNQPEVEAAIRTTIGRAYLAIGEYTSARTHLQRAMDIRRRELGDEHPDTLSTIAALGAALNKLGEFKQALDYGEEALDARRRMLGNDHPDTLSSMNDVGNQLATQGRPGDAEPLISEALEGRRRVLGNDHPDTLRSLNALGALRWDQGRFAEAEVFYREAVKGLRRVLGEDHPYTLASVGNLGRLLRIEKKLEEAETYIRLAMEGNRRVQGEHHPDTLGSINSLAVLLSEQGNFAEAEPYFRAVLDGRRRTLGDDSPDTLISINNMGAVLNSMGRPADAEPYYRQALDGNRRIMGPDHPDTLRSLHNMGALMNAQGQRAEAEAYYARAVEARRRVLGNDHPDTVVSMDNLARVLLTGEPLAPETAKRALELALEVNTASRYSRPQYLDTLAQAYHHTGDNAEAIEMERKALEGLPPDSPLHAEFQRRLAEFTAAQARPAGDAGQD
jgi:tetratricopeptide (TPR) repeat protein